MIFFFENICIALESRNLNPPEIALPHICTVNAFAHTTEVLAQERKPSQFGTKLSII